MIFCCCWFHLIHSNKLKYKLCWCSFQITLSLLFGITNLMWILSLSQWTFKEDPLKKVRGQSTPPKLLLELRHSVGLFSIMTCVYWWEMESHHPALTRNYWSEVRGSQLFIIQPQDVYRSSSSSLQIIYEAPRGWRGERRESSLSNNICELRGQCWLAELTGPSAISTRGGNLQIRVKKQNDQLSMQTVSGN